MSFQSHKWIIQQDYRVLGTQKKERNGAIEPVPAQEKAQGTEYSGQVESHTRPEPNATNGIRTTDKQLKVW